MDGERPLSSGGRAPDTIFIGRRLKIVLAGHQELREATEELLWSSIRALSHGVFWEDTDPELRKNYLFL